MNIIDLIHIVRRWWWLTFLMVALTVAAAAAVFTMSEPDYAVSSPLLIETPSAPEDEVDIAPLLANALEDGEVRSRISSSGGTGLYDVVADDGGVITISAIASDGSAAVDSVAFVQEEAEVQLPVVAAQSGVDADRVSLRVLSAPGVSGVTEEDSPIASGALLVEQRPAPTNPYANGDYSSQVVLTSLNVALAAGTLDLAPAVEVETEDEFRNPAPVVALTVTGPTPKQVEEAAAAIQQYAADELDRLQDELQVPDDARATVGSLRAVTQVEEIPGSPMRAAVAVVLLGAIATIAVVIAADTVSVVRRRRREEAAGVHAAGTPAAGSAVLDDAGASHTAEEHGGHVVGGVNGRGPADEDAAALRERQSVDG